VKPFFFGRSQRPMFGIHHAAAGGAGTGAVVLCNPFGQEAIRSHRTYRVLAARLARAGLHVLRFDYSATGDSAGSGEEADQTQWIDDVLEASDELASMTGARRMSWVGLRYGATIAALAAEKAPRPLAELVLWDPVLKGATYLDELADAHTAFMREDLADWVPPHPPPFDEIIGFPMPPALRRSLETLDLSNARKVRASRSTVVVSRSDAGADLKRSLAGWSPAPRCLEVASTTPWNSEQAMNSSLVPMEIVDVVVACLT
jgi:pimeloyl-ACP methyl ester carboxylesterase